MQVISVDEKLAGKGGSSALRYIRCNGGVADLCFGSAHQRSAIRAEKSQGASAGQGGINAGLEAGLCFDGEHRSNGIQGENSQSAGNAVDGVNVYWEIPDAAERLRGNLVEIIFSQVGREAAKPLKKMVGTTGIEPVTPTMSR